MWLAILKQGVAMDVYRASTATGSDGTSKVTSLATHPTYTSVRVGLFPIADEDKLMVVGDLTVVSYKLLARYVDDIREKDVLYWADSPGPKWFNVLRVQQDILTSPMRAHQWIRAVIVERQTQQT